MVEKGRRSRETRFMDRMWGVGGNRGMVERMTRGWINGKEKEGGFEMAIEAE